MTRVSVKRLVRCDGVALHLDDKLDIVGNLKALGQPDLPAPVVTRATQEKQSRPGVAARVGGVVMRPKPAVKDRRFHRQLGVKRWLNRVQMRYSANYAFLKIFARFLR